MADPKTEVDDYPEIRLKLDEGGESNEAEEGETKPDGDDVEDYDDDAIEDHIVSDAIKALSEDMKVLSETVGNLVAKVNSVASAQDVMLSNGAVVHEEDETPDLDAFGMDGISIDDLDLTL